MNREKYYNLVYRLLVRLWGREPTPGDRVLIMCYVGTPYAKTLAYRQRIVLWVISWHLSDVTKNSKD